jgi:cytochrome P450
MSRDFESALGLLYLNFLPSLTATAGHRARLDFAQAFKRYYDNNHHLNASAIIQARYKTQKAGGFTSDDIASFDIGLMLASTMNSIPAVFWLLTNIYSSPSLLASLRTELAPIFTVNEGKATLSVSALNTKCPLLVSTWQETLRLTDATVSARMVTEDTLLDNQYFLKKGAFIQLACGPMHTSPSIWGSSSTSFVPSRFTPSSVATLSKDEKKQRKAGYAPFGGGVVLCPGRYFATTEILGVVATMVMGYEITSAHGVALHVPAMEKQKMSVQVKHPVGDLDVCIVRRQGWEEVMWGYELGSSGSGSGDNGEEGGVFG